MIYKINRTFVKIVKKRREKMEVWVVFGIGFFLGGFLGVFAMGLLFMARER
jgi:hypothetical protein